MIFPKWNFWIGNKTQNWRMDLGKTIRRLRQGRGWAIEDLAAYLDDIKGGDRASISKIETGQRWPRPEMLQGLARAFDLEVHQLFALAEGLTLPTDDTTPEEREWLRALKAAPADTRPHLIALAQALAKR